jgi:2-polyprenyl-3-methyl-5-hydroxy-6-metoxy-1,4-benzoquinol methylase
MLEERGLLTPWLERARKRAILPELRGTVLDIGCHHGALASEFAPEDYAGFDIDHDAIQAARRKSPNHRFYTGRLPDERFETIAAVAVIEHVEDARASVAAWLTCLKEGGRLVLTTPHQRFAWVHDAAAKVGLASKIAAADHKQFFDRDNLVQALSGLPLRLCVYRRFLFGMNQLFVFERV